MGSQDASGAYTTLSSRIAYQNRWLRVREDVIRHPNGMDGLYGVVERHDFAVIAALGDDRSLTLVEQFRYPVGQRLWELPMGMWEERPDASAVEIARQELAEETGLLARDLVEVADLFQAAGYANQRGHVFLATGLTQVETRREATEQEMVARRFALSEIESMVCDGRIKCMVTLAALGLLRFRNLI